MSQTPSVTPGEPQIGSREHDADLDRVMREVPRGALALAGLTTGLLLLGWILIYALVFLPRGMVS